MILEAGSTQLSVPAPALSSCFTSKRSARSAACALSVAISWRQGIQSSGVSPQRTGQQGDFGRNVLRASEPDMLMSRFSRFRREFFNIFNYPNFGPPNNSLTSPMFGQSTQTLASSLAPVALTEASTRSVISAVHDRCSWRLSFSFDYQTVRSGALQRTSRVLPCDKPGASARAKEGRALRRLRAASFHTGVARLFTKSARN
jgi:hypothetical protein